jgi:peptidyl-prolyl cis-trans isomerase A (cyclophilin A)
MKSNYARSRRAGLRLTTTLAAAILFTLTACTSSQSESTDGAKAAGGNPVVVLTTSKGAIEVELYPEKAPKTVENFLAYVDAGFYDGTVFHRVIKDFMIQGGGFGADHQQKPTREPIKNEADNGLANDRGTIAMARTGIVDSATAQFFINHASNAFLNHRNATPQGYGYAVFGKVTSGMDVVDAIATSPTTNKGGAFVNAPVEEVVIQTVRRKD